MEQNKVTAHEYQGNDRLLLGMVLGVITFWLFAQTTLNIAPTMRTDLGVEVNTSNIAVSITALFSGIFIVVFGGLGDRFGRVKMTKIGIALSIIGSLLIAASPKGTAFFLMSGRIIQGLSAACIMPNTLALIKAYYPSSVILGLAALAVVTLIVFYQIERSKENSFIDFNLFSNKTYTGATISNFLLNGSAGTLIVALTLVQLGAGLTSFQAGLLTIGYLIAILMTIRVGEKLLQKWGARKPMILGCFITGAGIFMTSFTYFC